jgi:hypothetical protein
MIPYEQIPNSVYGRLLATITSHRDVRQATSYESEKLVVKATAQTYGKNGKRKRPDLRTNRETFLVTVGAPNYAEREFIKQLVKAGEPFPVKKIQLKFLKK